MRKTIQILTLGAALALAGCAGTVSPDPVHTEVPAVDSSTPPQYPQDSNGFINYHDNVGWITRKLTSTLCWDDQGHIRKIQGIVFGVITENKRAQYDLLISEYPVRFKTQYAKTLLPDAGLTPWKDPYGNLLWAIDEEHLEDLQYLEKYRKAQYLPDQP